ATDAEIPRSSESSIIRPADPMRDFAREQAAEDEAETPRHHRRKHRKQRDESGRAFPALRNRGHSANHRINRRRSSESVAADDDHRHLHRESYQIPEAGAEPLRSLNRSTSDRE